MVRDLRPYRSPASTGKKPPRGQAGTVTPGYLARQSSSSSLRRSAVSVATTHPAGSVKIDPAREIPESGRCQERTAIRLALRAGR